MVITWSIDRKAKKLTNYEGFACLQYCQLTLFRNNFDANLGLNSLKEAHLKLKKIKRNWNSGSDSVQNCVYKNLR